MTPYSCPHCQADLRDLTNLPGKADDYGHRYGSRAIAVVDPDLDRIVAYKCPDCGERGLVDGNL